MPAQFAVSVVLAVARLLLWVREATNHNDGPPVEAIQKSTGNKRGDPWCASVIYFVGRVLNWLGLRWPLPKTASCDELLRWAREQGVLMEGPNAVPVRGDVGLVMRTAEDAIHAFFVDGVGTPFKTIEGNTNPGGGRDGYGMFERERGGAEDPALKAGLSYAFIRWSGLVR